MLNLALLGGATINTYLATANGAQLVQSLPQSGKLLGLALLATGLTQASFLPSQPFDQVEFTFFFTMSLGQDTGIQEAYTPVAALPVVLTAFRE